MTATASGARERIDMPSAIVTPDPFDTRRLLPDRPAASWSSTSGGSARCRLAAPRR